MFARIALTTLTMIVLAAPAASAKSCPIVGSVTGGQKPDSPIVLSVRTKCDGPHAPTITRRVGTVDVAPARGAGTVLAAAPTDYSDAETSPQLDLEQEWRVWQFGYWNCGVGTVASGGTPVIFCTWVPAHWVVEPYGTDAPQPGVAPGSTTPGPSLRRLRHVPNADLAISSGHGPVQRPGVQQP